MTGTTNSAGDSGERFTGHGSEWRDSNLSAQDARTATSWVEARVDKRSMLTNKDRVEDVRDVMWQLEKDGEIAVHRLDDGHRPVEVKTLYGWTKRIPTTRLWHHKSCGQCGNIPGYPASLLWLMNEFGTEYLDETDQTSCTAWNYHGSGIGNLESLSAVFLRNFHQAYVSARAQGLPDAYYYPLVHCGTSFGNYKEVRQYLLHSAELRDRVKKILGKLDRLVDGKLLIPEEIVHYSEWLHVVRDRIAARQTIDASGIRATIHPACHVYKMVPEDAIYDDDILEGNRVAVSTGVMDALGAPGDRLFDLVRLLRFRLPPHHFRTRVHPVLRHRPQDQGRGGRGAGRRDDRPRHRLHHDAGQEPVDRQGRRQGLRPTHSGGLPVRGTGLRRPSVQDRPVGTGTRPRPRR